MRGPRAGASGSEGIQQRPGPAATVRELGAAAIVTAPSASSGRRNVVSSSRRRVVSSRRRRLVVGSSSPRPSTALSSGSGEAREGGLGGLVTVAPRRIVCTC